MNRSQAMEMDRHGEFYADLDKNTGMYCVFGSESGFAYSTDASLDAAERAASEKNALRAQV